MRKTTLAAGLVLLTIVLFINAEDDHQLSFKTIKNTLFNTANTSSHLDDQSTPEQHENEKNTEYDNSNSITNEELISWIKNESQKIDMTINNENDIEIATKQKASLFQPEQIEQLKTLILNPLAPINERIFANYVLTQTFTAEANQAMTDIINSTEAFSKEKPLPHSEQEIKRNQEYALRFILIDETITRIQKNGENPLDFLIGLSEKTNDPQIKMYALQKAKALSKK